MTGAAKLYSPELLAAAVELAKWPPAPELPFHGQARSATCGSTISVDLDLNDDARISALGLRVHACAVGQASAAIFAGGASGRSADEIRHCLQSLRQWLAGEAALPNWPGLTLIEPARDYPGRHGAILLGWQAASTALSTAASDG